jgi:hypothetical protein
VGYIKTVTVRVHASSLTRKSGSKDFLNNEERAVKSRPSSPLLVLSGNLTAEAP